MLTGTTAAATLMDSDRVADPDAVSVALTVKFEVPEVVGVPVIWPDAPRFSPAGNEPDAIDHVKDPVPPLACSVCEYAAPT
jgi:hypothetical protein